jgi:hypothetical protein
MFLVNNRKALLEYGGELSMQETASSESSITPEQAKAKVFEHWDHLKV